jgi:hypothetical protein
MAKRKTHPKAACCGARVRLCDTDAGLKGVSAVLDALGHHEGNVRIDDDPDHVMAVRFALLDAACHEIEELRDEIADTV